MPTLISWADETWNPVTGCSKVSEGCRNCYAERLSLKYGWTKQPWLARHAMDNVLCRPERLTKPNGYKKPSRVFVNSMSDLFHEQVPDAFIDEVFHVMRRLPQHRFLILSKRPERAAEPRWEAVWRPWIWMGTSVEDARALPRIDALRSTRAWHKFISFEPLLGPVGQVNLAGIDWVIVGGESGPGYRPMDHAWAREIRDQSVAQKACFFFKQSAAAVTERGTELIEADGSKTVWHQEPRFNGAASLIS